MPADPPLQPTLWRTCRVLANRSRLQLLQLLAEQPSQTVSSLAARLKLPLPVASQYLRALEARGLLTCRRAGLRVIYRLGGGSTSPVQELLKALRMVFKRETAPVEMLFRAATAFTHPRRIELFRACHRQPRTWAELKSVTGASNRALARHLSKLEDRGFIVSGAGRFAVAERADAIGRELARMAAA
jgi:DNA-binding transcriptional ArsR family regulator